MKEGQEKKKKNSAGAVPPPRPPPPKTPPTTTSVKDSEGEWLTTRRPLTSTPRRPLRWVSPPPQPLRPESPPPPYQGIIVREVPQRPQSPPPPYGEVVVRQNGDAVQGKYFFGIYFFFFFFLEMLLIECNFFLVVAKPVVPSAPPRDEGFGSASSSSSSSTGRGAIRPHSVSPFLRSVRQRLMNEGEEEVDLEAISCLLDFASRDQQRTPTRNLSSTTVSTFTVNEPSGSSESKIMVRTFAVSPPTTPAPAPRPERPPPIISSQLRHTCHSCVRPRALRGAPPAAALGAPPAQDNKEEEEEEMGLPDIPETPASPATSDITVIRLVNFFKGIFLWIFFFLCYYDFCFYFLALSAPRR